MQPSVLGFQIIATVFILFALTRTVRKFREQTLGIGGLVGWFVLWILAGLVVLRPSIASRAAELLGITRGADLVVYLAIIALFYLLFRTLTKIELLEQEITKVVRAAALREGDDQKNH